MTTKNKVLQAVWLLIASSAAEAAPVWEASLSLGRASVDESFSISNQTASSVDDSGSGFAMELGYRLDAGVLLYMGYVDMGDGSASFTTQSTASGIPDVLNQSLGEVPVLASGITAGVSYTFFNHEAFFFNANLGLIDWEADISSTVNNNSATTELDGTDLLLGASVGYTLTEQWNGFLKLQRYQLNPNNVTEFQVGLTYRF
ncbi:MAG: outer membrane beta-barrel protein [Aestuariibacter sp.]